MTAGCARRPSGAPSWSATTRSRRGWSRGSTRGALYATLRTDFILPAVEAAAAGRSEEAERLYTAMVRHLEEQREIG